MRRLRAVGDLTPRQRRALEALAAYIAAHGYAPSRRELAEALGVRSMRSVTEYLERLHEAGVIVYTPGIARGITLTTVGRGLAAGG